MVSGREGQGEDEDSESASGGEVFNVLLILL